MIKKDLLDKVVQEYSKFHGAEAQVQVLKHEEGELGEGVITARFTGPYCFSCAPEEYYADFKVLLEELTGLRLKVGMIKQDDKGASVDFKYAET